MARQRNPGGRLTKTITPAFLCLSAVLGPLFSLHHAADEEPSLEYGVKAAFLLNFTKFVEWPSTAFAGAGSPFAICVLGKDPFGRVLDDVVEGETVAGRKLTVRRISRAPDPQTCQLVYFAAPAEGPSSARIDLGHGVLTVGEGESFVREGGMIGFVIDHRRVRFDINRSAAAGAALKLSSRLLSVARSAIK